MLKRVSKAISWLMSTLLLIGVFTGNGAFAAKPVAIGPSGFEPTVTSQTLDTPYATAIAIPPIFTFDGINLQFCLVEAHGNNCRSVKNASIKADRFTVAGQGTWDLTPSTGLLLFTPDPSFSGLTTAVTLQANDSFGSGSGKIAVRVGSPLAPSLSTTIAATQFETPITVTPQATGGLIVQSSACLLVSGTCDVNNRVSTPEGDWVLDKKDGSVTFTPATDYSGSASIGYQIADSFGQAVNSQIVVGVANPSAPVASPQNPNAVKEKDDVIRTEYGQPITFKIKTKGSAIVAEKFCFVDPITAICAAGQPLVVEGEGTWSIVQQGSEPVVKFTPLATFAGDATPIDVRVSDAYRANGGKCKNPLNCNSQTGTTKLKVRVKNPTQQLTGEFFYAETQFNTPISFSPEIQNSVNGTKLDYCVIDPADSLCKSKVIIDGKGTWTTGNGNSPITFTPDPSFAGMTEPIGYMTTDSFGRTTDQPYSIQVHVAAPAKPRISFNGTRRVNYGDPTTLTPSGFGKKIDYSTACLVDPVAPHACKKTVDVSGKGTWTIGSNGAVTFTPIDGVTGAIEPIEFHVTSLYGPSPKCDVAGPDASGNYASTEFYDDPETQSVGTYSCAVTGIAWLNIEYSAATSPRVFKTVGTTDFQTTKFFTPQVHTARGVGIDNSRTCLVDPADDVCKTEVVIEGRGTFTVDTTNRSVRFIPLATFAGVTPALLYRIQDTNGQIGENWVRITVNLPNYAVVYETYNSTTYQTPITFKPNYLAVNPQYSTACLIDPKDLLCKTTVVLDNQGTYVVNQTNGEVTFYPAANFVGVVTPIAYQIVDGYGWVSDGCNGQNFSKCYDTTDTCNKLDRGDHNAMFGDDCNKTIGGQHDNDLNNGKRDHQGEYLDFCSAGYGDGDGEDDDNGFRGDHYGHDTADPYGWSRETSTTRDSDSDSLSDDSHHEGDYDEGEDVDEGDDEGSHYCKNLITSWLFMTVTSDGSIEAFPFNASTPYQTPITNFRPNAQVTGGNASIDWTTLCLVDSSTNSCVNEIVLPGYGTFSYNTPARKFTFTPEQFFSGEVPTVYYKVCDTLAASVPADELFMHCAYSSIKIRVADPDEPVGLPTHEYTDFETDITFPANVSGSNLLWNTACLVDPRDGLCKQEVVFDGEGTYRVDFSTGLVTFEPADDFFGDATHVTYRVVDGFGLSNSTSDNQCLLQDPYKFLQDGIGSFTGANGGIYNCFAVVQSDTWVTVNPPGGPVANPVYEETAMETPVDVLLDYIGFKVDPAKVCLIKTSVTPIDCVRSWFIAGYGNYDLLVDEDNRAYVRFTPVDGFYGDAPTISYRVTDASGATDESTIDIRVLQSAPPKVAPYTETIDFFTSTSFTPRVTGGHIIDTSSSCITLASDSSAECIPGQPVFIEGQGHFDINGQGVVTFYADYGFAGDVDEITYTICDDLGQCASGSIKIKVRKPPLVVYNTEDTTDYDTDWSKSPVEWNGSAANNPGNVMQYEGVFVDVKGGCFLLADTTCVDTVTKTNEGTWSIDSDGKVTFNPLNTFANAWTSKVYYQLCDGFEQCESAWIRVYVNKPQPPVVDDLETTTPYEITKTDMQPDYTGGAIDEASACVYAANAVKTNRANCVNSLDVAQGTWTVNDDGTVDFNPIDGFAGDVEITYEVCDLWGQCDQATIKVTVEKPEPPQIDDIDDETDFNTNWSGTPEQIFPTDGSHGAPVDFSTACIKFTNVLEQEVCETSYTDPDGNTWTVDEDGKITLDPAEDFAGEVEPITYCVKDDFNQEACATITITVGKPAPPTVTPLNDETPWETNWTVKTEKDSNQDLVCDPATAGYSCARPEVQATHPDFTSACFVDPLDSTKCEKTLTIDGQGTFTIDGNGDVTFNPDRIFGDATTSCALYRIYDDYDQSGEACVKIHVLKPAPKTISPFSGTTPYVRESQPVEPTDLDLTDPSVDPSTACIRFTDPNDSSKTVCEKEYTDPKGSKWSIDPTTGGIKLDPSSSVTGLTGPVTYCVSDIWDQEVCTTVTFTVGEPIKPTDGAAYKHVAYNSTDYLYPGTLYTDPTDPSKKLPLLTEGSGSFVSYCIWMNDACLVDSNGDPLYSYEAPISEGVWTLNPATGAVMFEANTTFYGAETEQLVIRAIDEFDYTAYFTVQVYIDNPVTLIDATENSTAYMTPISFIPAALDANGNKNTDWEKFLVRSTACVIDATKSPTDANYCVKDLVIPNVGEWLVNATSGEVTFIPAEGYAANGSETTQVTYRVTDIFNQYTSAPQKVTVAGQPLATLEGTVYLDLNKDNQQNSNEPGLPGIEVTANANTQGGTIFKPVVVQRAGLAGGKRVGIAAAGTYKVVTDRNGNYTFTVKPASYSLSAVLRTTLISKSSQGDPDAPETGTVDWSLNTPVVTAGQTLVTDFGAAGTGALTGTVVINGSAPVPNATVQCMWGGLDGIIGIGADDPNSLDDVLVTGVADATGKFNFEGIPGGAFECQGESTDGQKSSPSRTTVDQYSGKPAFVTLPLRKSKRIVFTISGFPAGRPTFTNSMKRQLRANMARYALQGTIRRISIDGFTMGPTVLQVDHKLSLDRARAAWSLIQTQDNTIKLIGYRGIQDYQMLGKKVRRVTITLYYY